MSDKLTDAQVAALADGHWQQLYERYIAFDETGDRLVVTPTIHALALEVQQARQRRCGNCRYAKVSPWTENMYCDSRVDSVVEPDFGCADFTPKEER